MSRFRKVLFLLLLFMPTSAFAVTAGVEDAKSIARLYSAAFARKPDIGGLNYWIGVYEAGQSLPAISGGFYSSPEFTTKYGTLSDQQYVEQLYRNVLGRAGEEEGVSFWTNHLSNGVSRARILAEFAASPENIAKTADTFADLRMMNCQWLFGPEQPISGNTGCLVGLAASGVTYRTPTHHGVTGPGGDFHYEAGETVRFTIGDTLLGEVMGQEKVTLFDLAGSPVLTGTTRITDSLNNKLDPFQAVVNITVLLQSLDRDAYPENGIEITPAVVALFREVKLDMNQHWEKFREDSTLRHAIGTANTRSLFTKAHGIATPAPALQQLYQALEIDPRIFARTLKEWDIEGDGVPNSTVSFTYDARGNVTRLESDDDADGTPNSVARWVYDIDGRWTQHDYDEDGDGITENLDNWQYDAYGNVTRREREMNGDGILDQIWSYEYDLNGNATRFEDDYDADGTPELVSTYDYEYDARGNVTRLETDYDTDGTPDEIVSSAYEYDDQGRLTRLETDYDADGTPDRVEITQYQTGDDGSSSVTTISEGYGGPPRPIHILQYDVSGSLIREESLRGFREGAWYVVVIYEYFNSGNLARTTETSDTDDNGKPDQIRTSEYDAHGNLVRETTDYQGIDTPESITNYQYDTNNYLVRKERIWDRDDLPDETRVCQYLNDTDGNVARAEGECEEGVGFDPAGNLVQHRLVKYEYEATGWGAVSVLIP